MATLDRRTFLKRTGTLTATLTGAAALQGRVQAAPARRPQFTMDLRCGSIGVAADQRQAIELAARHGFESVTPEPGFLAGLTDAQQAELLETLRNHDLSWGAAGLPVEFRKEQARFESDLKRLPKLAGGLQRAGVTRVGTWLSPAHDELTYIANFRQHAKRLSACARVLNDHGLRLGLEYVGPKTSWTARRFPFLHTMAELKDLLAEIREDNVGFVLDSWHWYTAGETLDDLRTLRNRDVVACDLNDAPAGRARDEQIDSQRELPTATGVIDLKGFLGVLVDIGYDGPIRAEPFNRTLNELQNEAAVAATAKAMRSAFALVGAGS